MFWNLVVPGEDLVDSWVPTEERIARFSGRGRGLFDLLQTRTTPAGMHDRRGKWAMCFSLRK